MSADSSYVYMWHELEVQQVKWWVTCAQVTSTPHTSIALWCTLLWLEHFLSGFLGTHQIAPIKRQGSQVVRLTSLLDVSRYNQLSLWPLSFSLSLSLLHTTPVATLYMYYMGLIRYSKTHSQNGAIFQFVGLHGSLLAVPSVSQIGEM